MVSFPFAKGIIYWSTGYEKEKKVWSTYNEKKVDSDSWFTSKVFFNLVKMSFKLFTLWIAPKSSKMDQNHILKVDQNDIFLRVYEYYRYENPDHPSIENG